ncbi:MAG: M28 family peptidase [Chitinophagaceae bacterium]|nr:M28 family peptidase [Chitinophagaceae bacterium]MCB9044997.1 M28 family peptidase [Chitinophagales bacterium]
MNLPKIVIILFIYTFTLPVCKAQEEKSFIKKRIDALASPGFHGRGYVMNGNAIAADYIAKELKSYGVQPIRQNGSYLQDYTFSVNTFPGKVLVEVNGKKLRPGPDYILNGASNAWHSKKPKKMKYLNLAEIRDSISWDNVKKEIKPGSVYYLQNADTPANHLKLGIRKFATELPEGLFIVPKHGKLTWTANTNQVPGTIIYIEDTVLPAKPKKVLVDVDAKYIKEFNAKNVMGYVKGTEVADSFIVFTAHFDHLGRMGKTALFPGASDNASGTSMVLYLASYFAKHPQRYSIAFVLFSGEEAGLLGSEYYVSDPAFPLEQIRFLVNLDMTGDATNGITVVNGVAHEPEFALLQELNVDSLYATKINKRERTSNSDHYHFSKNGVPAVFIYSMGTNGHYHDVFDVAKDISLERVDDLAHLLIKFTGRLTGE